MASSDSYSSGLILRFILNLPSRPYSTFRPSSIEAPIFITNILYQSSQKNYNATDIVRIQPTSPSRLLHQVHSYSFSVIAFLLQLFSDKERDLAVFQVVEKTVWTHDDKICFIAELNIFYFRVRNDSVLLSCLVPEGTGEGKSRPPAVLSWSPNSIRSRIFFLANFKGMDDSPAKLYPLFLDRMIWFMKGIQLRSGDAITEYNFGISNTDWKNGIFEDDYADECASGEGHIDSWDVKFNFDLLQHVSYVVSIYFFLAVSLSEES